MTFKIIPAMQRKNAGVDMLVSKIAEMIQEKINDIDETDEGFISTFIGTDEILYLKAEIPNQYNLNWDLETVCNKVAQHYKEAGYVVEYSYDEYYEICGITVRMPNL